MRFTAIVIALFLATAADSGPKSRAWKTGTLLETKHVRETSGGGPVAIAHSSGQSSNPAVTEAQNGASDAMAAAAARPVSRIWIGFLIEGDVYRFMVTCSEKFSRLHPNRPGRLPNVTVNGPVKYALEQGRFFLLDEDGQEFEMTVLEKTLIPGPQKPQR